jgi:hypothetical protein
MGLNIGPMEPTTNSKLNSNLYQEQYDPNQDFAVFGMSDNTKGGIDSLKNKINQAEVIEAESSNEEDNDPDHSTGEKISSVSPAGSATEFNKESYGNNSDDQPLSGQAQNNNNLPEDSEIVNDDEYF